MAYQLENSTTPDKRSGLLEMTTAQRMSMVFTGIGYVVHDIDLDASFYLNSLGWHELVTKDYVDNLKSILFSKEDIVISPSVANSVVSAMDKTINLPVEDNWTLHITANMNANSTTGDCIIYGAWDNSALDLNDRDLDPQGKFQISRIEAKDSANSTAGPITGTGSGQKLTFSKVFDLGVQPSGNHNLVISIGSETASLNSIWNITGTLQRVNKI